MLKNRSKQNSYHACNFIHNYREKMFCLEHLIKMNLSHTRKNAMLSPPAMTNVEVNGEGSQYSFSIGMHDMKTLHTKCEWIASTKVVLVWTVTLKRKNSAKIGSPSGICPKIAFFPLIHWDRSRYSSLFHY